MIDEWQLMIDDEDDNVDDDINNCYALTRARWVRAAGFGLELQAANALKQHIYISHFYQKIMVVPTSMNRFIISTLEQILSTQQLI